jgi:MFS family permease
MSNEILNPYQKNPTSKKMLTVIAIYLGVFVGMTISIGNGIFLPLAAEEIGGADIYSLAATLSGVISVGAMPLFAFIASKSPHLRRQGLALSLLAGVLCVTLRALAPNMWWIIIPAVFLGLESAAIYTFGYAIIRDCFNQKQAGVYLGFIGTMFAAGSLVAPVAVAAIIQFAGWRIVPASQSILWAICAIMVFAGARITKEEGKSIAYTKGSFDVLGAVSLICLLGGLILALSLGNFAPVGSPISLIFFGVAAVALIITIYTIRKKKEEAIIPSIAFKDRNTLAMTAANFLSPFDSMSTNFFLPAFIMTVLSRNPVESSFALSLYSVLGIFLSPFFGRWIARIGTCKPIIIWFSGAWRVIITVALIIYLKPGANIYVIDVLMFLAGLYSTTSGVIASTGPQIMIEPKIRQQSNALVQLGQNFGGTLGVAVYSAIIAVYGLTDGMRIGLMVACAGAVALMVSGLFMTKPTWQQESRLASTT